MKASFSYTILAFFVLTLISCSKTEEVVEPLVPQSSDFSFIKNEIQEFERWAGDISPDAIAALELKFELVVPDGEFCQQDCGEVPPEYLPYAAPENVEKINAFANLLGFDDGVQLFLHVTQTGALVNELYSKFQPVNRTAFLEDLVNRSFDQLNTTAFDRAVAVPVFRSYLKSAYGDFTQHASLGGVSLYDYVGAHGMLYGSNCAIKEVAEVLTTLGESLGN